MTGRTTARVLYPRMRWLPVVVVLSACGKPPGELLVSPTEIDWDAIDFQEDLPAEGYDARQVVVTNEGDRELSVTLSDFDTSRLILGALLDSEDPPVLPTMDPGDQQVITIGVWNYEDGERDTTVSGSFTFTAEGLDEGVTFNWSFIPIRDLVGDTGP